MSWTCSAEKMPVLRGGNIVCVGFSKKQWHRFVSGCLLLFLLSGTAVAEEIRRDTKRMEASYTFESLSPNEVFGDWKAGTLSFYDNPMSGFTYFVKGAFHNRPDGNGNLGTVGAYIDWSDAFYTYTAVTGGSHTNYLPEFRFDNDFNYKFGPQKQYIFTFGISTIDYYTDYSDLIFSAGPTMYWRDFVFQYRWFHNISDPGNVTSDSQLVSIGYGEEGRHWTFFNVSAGNQAYLVAYVDRDLTFDNSSYDVNLQHRHWIGQDYGVFGSLGYFKLKNGYDKTSFSCGVFYEF